MMWLALFLVIVIWAVGMFAGADWWVHLFLVPAVLLAAIMVQDWFKRRL
jgi:hypothetical protein